MRLSSKDKGNDLYQSVTQRYRVGNGVQGVKDRDGEMEPILGTIGRGAGHTLNSSPTCHRHRERQPFTLTLTPAGNLKLPVNLSPLRVHV